MGIINASEMCVTYEHTSHFIVVLFPHSIDANLSLH